MAQKDDKEGVASHVRMDVDDAHPGSDSASSFHVRMDGGGAAAADFVGHEGATAFSGTRVTTEADFLAEVDQALVAEGKIVIAEDRDKTTSGEMGNAEPQKGFNFQCSECQIWLRASECLILQKRPGQDTWGTRYQKCFNCCQARGPWAEEARAQGRSVPNPMFTWDGVKDKAATPNTVEPLVGVPGDPIDVKNKKHFKTRCAAAMCKLRREKGEDLRSLDTKQGKRTKAFQDLMMECVNDPKRRHMAYEDGRSYALSEIKSMVIRMAVDLQSMAPKKLAEAATIFDHYVGEKEKEHENLGYICQPQGKHLTAETVSYLHAITEKVSRFYVCRWKTCRFVGYNTSWISTDRSGGYQFRCPLCGEQFRANATGDHLVPAAFAFTAEMDGRVMYIFAEWPNSAEDDFFTKLTELTAGVDASTAAMSDEELHLEITRNVAAYQKSFMKECFTLSPQVVSRVEEINRNNHKKTWHMEHLQGGFQGTRYDFHERLTGVMSFDDAKRVVAMLNMAFARAKKKLADGTLDDQTKRLMEARL